MPVRVILADHHEDVLIALAAFLKEETQVTVVGTATDAASLLSEAAHSQPDMILMDCELPGVQSAELIARLRALPGRPKVIAMSARLEDGRPALRAGADGFVSKTDEPDWALATLRRWSSQDGERDELG